MGRFKIICLCAFALCIYLFIIFKVGTRPFSDFRFYYEVALGIIQGQSIPPYIKYFQGPGYPYLLSIILRIYNHSILIPQILNALMLCSLIWFYLRYSFVHSQLAVLVGYLVLIFNLNYLSMVSVLCSEIPYAFFFLIGLYAFSRGFKILIEKQTSKIKGKHLYFIAAGLLFGVSQFIRLLTFPFLLLFSFFIIVGLRYFIHNPNGRGWNFLLKGWVIPFIATWASFFIGAILLYWTSGYGVTCLPQQKGLWSFYVAFNVESKGGWNPKDSELITRLGDKYDWDGAKVNKEFLPIVLSRIKSDWVKNLQIYPEKLYRLLDPKGIPLWAVEQSKIRDKGKIYRASNYLSWINGVVLIISVWAWIICLIQKKLTWEEFFAFCVLGATFVYLIVHGYFLEAQGRYSNHLWMVMFIFVPVSLRILKQSLTPKRKG